MSKIYAETGDFKNAYEYRKKYDELRYEQLDEQRSKDFTEDKPFMVTSKRDCIGT
ncbi:MAG: hypothetical protein R2769_11800 [Saprospiraceae bacterium]